MQESGSSSGKPQDMADTTTLAPRQRKGDKFSASISEVQTTLEGPSSKKQSNARKTGSTHPNAQSNANAINLQFYQLLRSIKGLRWCDVRQAFAWPVLVAYAHSQFAQQYAQGQGIVWYALAHLAGVLTYYVLPSEPWGVWSGMPAILLMSLGFWRYRRGQFRVGLGLALCFALGFALADFRSYSGDKGRLDRPITRKLEGLITHVKWSDSSSARVTLHPIDHSGARGLFHAGYKVRLSLKGVKEPLQAGDIIALKARMLPPGGVVLPGGYDFARTAFFDGVGAVGYGLSHPVVLQRQEGIGFWPRVDKLRWSLASRIRSVLDNSPESALSVALLVGLRDYIPQSDRDALRAAGLAHILAISGLHMGLVTSFFYMGARFTLSLSSALALRGLIPAFSACCAMVGATAYLLVSGASIPTQRAYFMVMLVLVASVLGRKGISVRSLALACLLLLSLAPEELLNPGFQMSFLAVLALISTYVGLRHWQEGQDLARSYRSSWGRRALLWLGACITTSVVAGLATGPVAALHFQEVAPYGLIGNILAMPLITFLVMPLGLLGVLTVPLGLDGVFLQGMNWALIPVLQSAHWVQSLSGGVGLLGAQSEPGYILLILLIPALCLLPGLLKFTVVPVFAAGMACLWLYQPPDLIVGEDGRPMAFYNSAGELRVTASRRSFSADSLLKALGQPPERLSEFRVLAQERLCDDAGCLYRIGFRGQEQRATSDYMLALSKLPQGLAADCALADVVVTALQAPAGCDSTLVIDQRAFAQRGAVFVWLGQGADGALQVKKKRWAYQAQRRPWNPQISIDVQRLIAAEERGHLALNADAARTEDASFVGGVGRFERD